MCKKVSHDILPNCFEHSRNRPIRDGSSVKMSLIKVSKYCSVCFFDTLSKNVMIIEKNAFMGEGANVLA